MENFFLAMVITLVAGLATGIGSIMAFVAGGGNRRFLAAATGFSAGVMLYISFVELLAGSFEILQEAQGYRVGGWWAVAAFMGGILFVLLIDLLVPASENPHESRTTESLIELQSPIKQQIRDRRLLRTGIFTAAAIAIHNFPEGLATFLVALEDPRLGIGVLIAVALHNIPEGISVSVPIYHATGNRKLAFGLSFLSGLAEPLGALVGFVLLRPFLSPELMGIIFGWVAGIMVYISLDELLPTSRAHGQSHDGQYGLVAGLLVCAVGLHLLHG